jgi:hypothetical protein
VIGAGVAALAMGLVLQALVVRSVSGEAPPQFGMNAGLGDAAALSLIAEPAIVTGVILAIIGVIRYAQSGRPNPVVFSSPAVHTVATEPSHAGTAQSAAVSAPAFCSSCGAGIVGEGRYCASCGAPTARE